MAGDVLLLFDVVSVSLVFAGCIIGTWFDVKKGRVPNKLTGLLLFSSLLIAAARIMSGESVYLFEYVKGICFGFIAGYVFWALKAWSGGDAKMLWAICALLPVYPKGLSLLFNSYIPWYASELFGLTFLLNLVFLLIFRVAVKYLYHFLIKKKSAEKTCEVVRLMPYFLLAFIVSLYSDMFWMLFSGR